jgi:hypothetical protein
LTGALPPIIISSHNGGQRKCRVLYPRPSSPFTNVWVQLRADWAR